MSAAILARRFAVAGATTTASASRASLMWPISASSLPVEQIRMRPLAGEGAGCEPRHKLLRARGENAAHLGAALTQPPDQIERLVGRDPPAHDEKNAFVGEFLGQFVSAAPVRSESIIARRARRRET
jgi:hypothetical protein